jgi:MFS family permease
MSGSRRAQGRSLHTPSAHVRRAAVRKAFFRLGPLIFLLYLFNYMDRTALGIAMPNGMGADLELTATMFGLASGIFFAGYILLEVPSVIVAEKVGLNRWISRIAVSWGLVAMATAFVPNYEWLVGARFLLGVAEAGFAPCVLLLLTRWFSNRERPKAFALYMLGIPVSSVIGAPLATWLITATDGVFFDAAGWRAMLFIVGIPPVILGVLAYRFLSDHFKDVTWLTGQEKAELQADIEEGTSAEVRQTHGGLLSALKSPRLWVLSFVLFGVIYGLYAIGFFMPVMIAGFAKQFGTTFSPLENGMLVAIPYVFATIALILWPRSASKRGDNAWHVLIGMVVAASGILLAAFSTGPLMTMIGVTLCAVGIIGSISLVYAMPAAILSATAAGTGIAFANTVGNAGGFFGPYITGWLTDVSGSAVVPFVTLAVILLGAGIAGVLVQSHTARLNLSIEASGKNPSVSVGV